MAVTRVGSPSYANGATSLTIANPQAPTAGNLMVLTVGPEINGASATCTTPTGYTAGPHTEFVNGILHVAVFTFWKVAVGGDAAPTVTVPGTTVNAILEEWTGLAASPHDADSAAGQSSATAAATLTDAVTTTNTDDWVYVGASSTAAFTPTWSGGVSQDTAPNTGSGAVVATAVGTYSGTGTKNPQLAYTGGGNGVAIASMAFKINTGTPASVAPPAGAATFGATAPGVAASAVTPAPGAAATLGVTAPVVSAAVNVAVPAAALTLSAQPPSLAVGGGQNLAIPAANLQLGATAPALTLGLNLSVPAAALTLGATTPTISHPTVNIDVRPLVIIGGQVQEIKSGYQVKSSTLPPFFPPTRIPAATTFTVPDDSCIVIPLQLVMEAGSVLDIGAGSVVEVH